MTATGLSPFAVIFMKSISKKLRRSLAAFGAARSGNVAITFALALLPVVGAVGAAVDYSHANSVKTALQSALDSTALMLAKSAQDLTKDELNAKALTYFNALFTRPEGTNVVINTNYTTDGGSTVVINGSADVPTIFMEALGYDKITVSGSSTTRWGSLRLRVALALDNTGSMASAGKMTALKAATKNLLDQLKTAAAKDGDVYVSIVPFNKDVNVGVLTPGNPIPPWLGWGGWDGWSQSCAGNYNEHQSSDRDDAAQKCGGSFVKVNNKWVWRVDHYKWNGCVMDRDNSPTAYNVSNASPSVTDSASLFPAEQFSECPTSFLPLTYDWTALRNKVDEMTPVGNTNTTIGLVHAWQTLTDGDPYNPPPIDTSDGIPTQKVIIFLTDGENTQDRFDRWNTANIDDRMRTACTNAKADNITIYTVLVLQGNESLLKSCASPDDASPKGPKYFKLTSADQLVTAFNQIGTSLSKLRVAK